MRPTSERHEVSRGPRQSLHSFIQIPLHSANNIMTTPTRLYPAAKQLDDQVPQEPLPSSLTEAHSLTVAVDVHIIDHVLHLGQRVQVCRRPQLPPASETMQIPREKQRHSGPEQFRSSLDGFSVHDDSSSWCQCHPRQRELLRQCVIQRRSHAHLDLSKHVTGLPCSVPPQANL